MNFREFNNLINPKDQEMYVASVSGRQAIKANASTIKKLSDDESLEVSWVIQDGYVVIETEQTSILEVIKARSEPVIVIQHGELDIKIIAKSDFNRTTKLNKLACGINANTYGPGKIILLPFKVKNSNSENLKKIDLVYGEIVGQLPNWLVPVRKISNSINDGITIPVMGNQQIVLLDILSKMKATGLSQINQVEVVRLVNKEFCNTPLQDYELENVLQLSEEQLVKQFFEKDKFFHDRLGNYVIKNCFVKRDEVSKELYFYNEKKKIYSTDVDYLMGYMTKLIPSLKHYQKEETLKYIQAYLYEESVRFNEDPYTIVFKNGLLNINTMEFEPMTPNNHESIQLNCNFNPNAKSAIVDEYFKTATNGKQEIEELLYESIGYSMLKTNELQKAFLLLGSGRNGKSTFLDLVKEILGKHNTTAISFKDLANNFRASAMNNKLASLAGDISSTPLQDSDLFKSIVSGEEIMVEQKYKDAQAKAMFATLFFAANKLPRTPDQSFGFYRRFTIIPFVADLNSVSRVDGLVFKQKLLSQESLDYAAYRGVKAIHKLLTTTKEFTTPEEVVAMMEQYKIDNSSVLSWFHERHSAQTRVIKNYTEDEAYTDYKIWCTNSMRHALNQTNFINSAKTEIDIEFKKK